MVIAANSSTDPDDQPIAYVGGYDLANDRWDTIYHNATAIRDAGHITFREKARIKAIKNAKNFIYIEDQYFVLVPELLEAIMKVMPKIQRLVVIANPQTSPFTNAGYIKYFYESVEPIRSKYPNKFKIYTTKTKRDILIHSKIVIIDDVYLSIGSANWNRRSMTSDSELNADVVDTETVKSPEGVMVGKVPRDFRIRKFQEMTGLSYKKLNAMTFVEAADQLPLAVIDKSSILANNDIQHKSKAMFLIALVIAIALSPTPSWAFSFSSLFDSSNSIGNESADLSDGTDIKPRQPLLDAEDWFLTEEEITASRGGIPRDGMAVYTTGNKVTTYTVANEFFNAVYDDLSTTKEGDRVMLAAWLAALVPLKPDVDPTGEKTGFKEVFSGIVERGGSVNILAWANIGVGYTPYIIKARDAINNIAPSPINGAKGVFIFDNRLPKALSSHHQKNMVIAANSSTDPDDQPVAYVGGIDLANDRWDTIYHNATAIRDAGHITFREKGWMDGHIRIHGPAAKDVASNFLDRWNSDYLPCQSLEDDLLDFKNPKYEHLPPLDYASSNTKARIGKQSIQIVRTFSCLYEHYKEFAPRGETSLFQAHIKAIKNAKNFIYIEDQYFVLIPQLLDAIMEVMPKIQRVIV
ncbi:PhosphoLipase D-like protein, partial [Phytophthora palmivora]